MHLNTSVIKNEIKAVYKSGTGERVCGDLGLGFDKSPEMLSYLARNFIMPQQYPSIPITICRACFVSSKKIE